MIDSGASPKMDLIDETSSRHTADRRRSNTQRLHTLLHTLRFTQTAHVRRAANNSLTLSFHNVTRTNVFALSRKLLDTTPPLFTFQIE